ncbi:hypothetical protein PUNSTDRAFT_103223 [Punctularia strigosozonata HHB-11173 SS5]|uniref:uncharacterized protein n=1 Tax=Punctularia strigosozonata (strain HHB-11173) TaxID=741275 RepID=UPI000441795E|nr:uncharacterized protein PUNSTDRAFT_103223 [Punctularia strigosozonata HHB-11173 SS5]EIN08380.1 hypothetical protein PUNSTDRAFT_103223 [Punctularia strigosozonata HHB-11173 SS5]
MDDFEKNLFRVAWEFTCQPLGESLDAARAVFRTWPHEKRFCHELYGFLLSDLRITPVCIQYVAMGFCTCSNLLEEYRLHRAYQELIKKCTFLEFYDAFISYSMLRFLDSKGLAGGLPRHFASATALVRPAVWDLKRYAVYDNMQEPPVEPNPVVAATYGFVNANSKEEADLLKKTYQQYFESKDADPLELHNVCQYGRIYEHVDSVIRLKSKRLRRLMKNV